MKLRATVLYFPLSSLKWFVSNRTRLTKINDT